jgi:hypothetical protein
MLDALRRFFTPLSWAASNLGKLDFSLLSAPCHPDMVLVMYGREVLFTYVWNDGAGAAPGSKLGRVHSAYKASHTP